eukprot:m.76583 g.76583  ORF g.76583 m.76583 type:complete len:111 (-) comp12565_c0_seq2:3020-3352(-)
MLIFCPICSNMLIIQGEGSDLCFGCPTCPYVKQITKKIAVHHVMQRAKKLEDDIVDDNANAGKPKADIDCPRCGHKQAYYHQMQTRSADEPSTIFYTCCNKECKHQWNEG